MRLIDLPIELLSAILVSVEDLRSIVLASKTFRPTVARIEMQRLIRTLEGHRSIATTNSAIELPAAAIIKRATEMVGGFGITLTNCNVRGAVKLKFHQARKKGPITYFQHCFYAFTYPATRPVHHTCSI